MIKVFAIEEQPDGFSLVMSHSKHQATATPTMTVEEAKEAVKVLNKRIREDSSEQRKALKDWADTLTEEEVNRLIWKILEYADFYMDGQGAENPDDDMESIQKLMSLMRLEQEGKQ